MERAHREQLETLVQNQQDLLGFLGRNDNLAILKKHLPRGFDPTGLTPEKATDRLVKAANAVLGDELRDPEAVIAFLGKLDGAYRAQGIGDFPIRGMMGHFKTRAKTWGYNKLKRALFR